jgi:hypothetical protein
MTKTRKNTWGKTFSILLAIFFIIAMTVSFCRAFYQYPIDSIFGVFFYEFIRDITNIFFFFGFIISLGLISYFDKEQKRRY